MLNGRLKILIALDGSTEAETILASVMPLVRARPADVTLYSAVADREGYFPARIYLYGAHKALKAHDVASDIKVTVGPAADEIVRLASTMDIDLLAMTTHGRSGLRRVLFGSIAEEVVRRSTVPVLLARPGTPVGDWKRIVVALDGSERAESILPDAAAIATLLDGTLLVTRVVAPVLVMPESPDRASRLEVEDVRPYLARVCEQLAAQGVKALPAALEGEPATALLRYAREIGAGLICMTTHGRTGLARLLSGSVAEAVIRDAPTPVLVHRAPSRETKEVTYDANVRID